MLQVTINHHPCAFENGISILDALRMLSIHIPTLCHDPRLQPYGGCRLCLVRVKGWPGPVTACNTLLSDGMEIETHSSEIERHRRTLLRLFAQRYPAAPARQFPDKEFHDDLRAYDLMDELRGAPDRSLVDDSHPYIRVDMSRCVHCYRCVRICNEVQGQFVWQVWNRGDSTRIRPHSQTTLMESSCVSCGACVDSCPTGALEDRSLLEHLASMSWTKTTCPYCGTGCEMIVGAHQGRIVSIRPALHSPVSKGHLCVKGRYAFDYHYAHDRITTPMIRQDGQWKRVSWEQAISFTAENLRRFVANYGPDSVAVLGSARATNEENYLAQKFARVALGTNNVDCCARVCHAPTAVAMKLMLGTGASTNSFDDIERARTLLVCGANPTENHPIVGARIKQAALQRGAHLIVIDPRRIELAEYADYHLPLRPGTNVPLLNAMAYTIVEEQLYDAAFLQERVSEWEEFRNFIQSWVPEQVAGACRVSADLIRRAARLYATAKPAMSIHGLGMTEHTQGTESVMCLVNLALLTGNLGKAGTGVNPLRGQNNVQGSAHMGCEPNHLTGFVALEQGKNLFESAWHAPLPAKKGLNVMEMMDAAEKGELKALWAIGYDLFLTNANSSKTKRALQSLDFVIVQDMFLNETAREFGSVFLPVASPFEKEGTFMNAERRIQRVRKVTQPLGQTWSDWEIICTMASAMGKGSFFNYHSPEEIWDEIRSVWKAGSGISYRRMEQAGLQWPCPSGEHPGTEILHSDTFPIGKRAALRRIEFNPTAETTSQEFPFLLITGRTLYHFNAGTMTGRTNNTLLGAADRLDIAPQDAQRLGLRNGQRVRIRSRWGEAILSAQLSPAIAPGELFATFQAPQVFLNHVTSPYRDAYAATPEYKVTAVAIEAV
ncbi:MAG: formate dehydrogenase subunit alpha [Acidobacteria bacterium]|nr:formate dehydrogenase subunit alpha [Acidobacteriota bacterium]